MRRIGIYGGTFNPPHMGHILGAQCAREALALDRLLLIPDRIAPHKLLPENSPTPWQRLELLQLAAAGCPGLEVSDMELRREGPSYTYETVEQVRSAYPDAQLFLLMGSDMFLSFETWKRWEEILSQVTLAVLCRGDRGEEQALQEKAEAFPKGKVILLSNPVTQISSTQLRRLLVFRAAAPFLPEPVATYIRQQRLYGAADDYRQLPMEQLEAVVVQLLKPSRVAHVLGCRDTAVRLARRYGANETHAARAALLHDVTKALDAPLQLTLCREYGIVLDDFSKQNPKTLHALTGSLVAEHVFGEDRAVVEAVRCHTTGKADMNLLEKILYVADYMEPNRDFPGVERLRALADTDITAALQMGLEMTLAMLKEQNRQISPESREALAFLTQR